jgi:transcriptional regulator with GAF, ATPase, and Fis domain
MRNLQRAFHDDDASNARIELAKSQVLKTLAYALLRQVYGVTEQRKPDVQKGINFYDEVRRFEVNLIKQALLYTNGKQTAAAGLLNMNATTLHSKIKFYRIEMLAIRDESELSPDIFAHPERR